MFQNLALFQTADAMARHASLRQSVTARNIANADTPGYRAQVVAPFEASYARMSTTARVTRPGHIGATETNNIARLSNGTEEPSPNGNTVSLEQEMVTAVDIKRQHDRALAIYKHALGVLRTSLGR